MTLYEYVCNITANGSRIIMPDFTAVEKRETVGEPGNNITRIMWVTEKTKAERREEKEDTGKQLRKIEKILAKVSEAAVICNDETQFYRKCMSYCPLDVRNGAFEAEPWRILQEDLVNEAMAHWLRKSYIERQSQSAKFLYSVIKDRLETFKKNTNVKIETPSGENEKPIVNINIQ